MPFNILDQNARLSAIQEITQNEDNMSRKREMQKRFDVYRDRQDRYIEEKLRGEYSEATLKSMRKVLSINLSKKIINEMASIYNKEPTRTFPAANDKEQEQIESIYESSKVNSNLRLANKYFKLFHQTALMVVPQNGKLLVRPLGPHQYDVIPKEDNPEEAEVYILNVWDLDQRKTTQESSNLVIQGYQNNDRLDQTIADDNDREALQKRFVWWSKEFHFTTNGNGQIINEFGEPVDNLEDAVVLNPIKRLPFIDIAVEKDFQFFVRRGQNVTEFTIDFGVQLSDQVETSRLQSYAQAVITSEKPPTNINVGPNKIIWMQINPAMPEIKPTFEFITASPDLQGALLLLEAQIKLFLSAEGIDTSAIVGSGDSRTFTSGMDRLLAMLDKFESSQADIDLFRCVEQELFSMMRDWSNALQNVTDGNKLDAKLLNGTISDNTKLNMKFTEPSVIETPDQLRARVTADLEDDLISKTEAIMELRGVDKDVAIDIRKEIKIDAELLDDSEPSVEVSSQLGSEIDS